MMQRKKFCVLLLGLSLLVANCAPLVLLSAGTAMGVLGSKYLNGELVADFKAPLIDTWDAVERALAVMEIESADKKHDDMEGEFKGRMPDGRPVTIRLSYKNSLITHVGIRVDLLGDQETALKIQERIKIELFGAS